MTPETTTATTKRDRAVIRVLPQKISPFLWFDSQAEEAANFYVSVFEDSRITGIACYTGAGAAVAGRPEGSVMTVAFELAGQPFTALNGGPEFQFTHAISFVVNCEAQAEVDRLWDALSAGGETEPCGWLRDRFGVSWQIVPAELGELMSDPDPASGKSNEGHAPDEQDRYRRPARAHEGG
jgi:predicted 3-demethylubiquinone-9 3-methyltransferase (glyoxalase superfamily)